MSDSDADKPEAQQKGFVAFRHADFRNYFLARSLARFAFEMQATAIGWQVYKLTGSAFDLGLVGLVALSLLKGYLGVDEASTVLISAVTGAVIGFYFGTRPVPEA